MPKRSRDASFSPSVDDMSSSASSPSSEGAEHPTKINIVTEMSQTESAVIQCILPPHRQPVDFNTIDAFEIHYIKDHSNRCSSCGKNFPTAHFLTLHIDENHNPLREELQAKGEKTYSCFVEGCEKICSTPQKRRLHLIDKHLFPKVYNFRIVDIGIDKSTTMLSESRTHRRRVSTTATPADTAIRHRRTSSQILPIINSDQPNTTSILTSSDSRTSTSQKPAYAQLPAQGVKDASGGRKDTSIEDLERSMSSLRFIPPSVVQRQRKPK